MKKIKSREWRLKKIKLFKVIVTLLVVVIGFYFSSYVDAGMNDTNLEKKRMDGIYAIASVGGVKRIFYLNMYEMNGKTSYCIDLGVDITTSIYHSTNDFSISYLTDEQIDYIRSISYFGYRYKNHDDYRYYMAAQELIWEYLDNEANVEWVSEMNVNAEIININSYKNEILELRDWYNKELNLNWYDEQFYTIGDEIVLSDGNNVLSDYEVVSSKYSDVFINDNQLVIKVGNAIDEEIIELRRKGYYDYGSSLYYYDGSQRLISNGNYKDVDKKLSFHIKGVSVKGQVVNKKNGSNIPYGQATLKGAVYELYNENRELIGTYETDEKGKFEISNLLFGTYYVKQIKASEGYLINEGEVKFELDKDNFELVLKQDVIAYELEIRKVYGHDGNYMPEKDILFILYDNKWNMYGSLNTNQYGIISLWLAYGEYTLRQWTTTYGYSKVDDIKIEVKEKKEDNKVYYNLVNELILVKVKVVNFEQKSGERIAGSGFSYKIRKKDENTYLEYEGKNIFTTNDNGEIVIPILFSYGDYVLEQVDVPDGYLLNGKEKEFSINDKVNLSLVDGNLIMNVEFFNELVMGKVNVVANEEKFYSNVNEYGYKKIAREGSEFSLVANEDIVVNGKVLYKSGQEIYNEITDNGGNLSIDNLYLGSYCLVDNETDEKNCFILESIDNKTKLVEKNLEFTKVLSKGNIIIQNISNKGDNISKSVFEILNKDGVVIYTGVTNEDGIIKVEDILNGDYCIRQKSINSSYQENKEEMCFLLENEKKINFINDLIVEEVIKVPDTLSEEISFYEVMVTLIMIGTGIFVYKKIFASKLYR